MRRFGVLLASAALGAVLVASGPGLAFGRGGGGGGHFGGFGPRFAGRSMAMGHFDRRHFDRNDRFRRFGRFDRDDRVFFGRGLFTSGFPLWGWGGGGGDSYSDNGYLGYNNPGSYYSYSTFYGAGPLASGASAPTGQSGNYCIISVKACQLHDPPFVGNDCSCKVQGGDISEVP